MFLKVVTPIRVVFNLDSSKIAARPPLFMEFLKNVRAALDDPNSALSKQVNPALDVDINLLPKAMDGSSDSSRDHSRFYLFPQVLTLRFRSLFHDRMEKIYQAAAAEADSAVDKFSAMLKPDLGSLAIRFNDNTVAVLMMDMEVDKAKLVTGRESWNRINDWAATVVKLMLRELYPDMVYPLLKGLMDFSAQSKDGFVLPISEYKIFFVLVGDPANPYPDLHKRFIPMKTTLTLCADGDFEKNHWVDNILRHGATLKLKEAEIHLSDENNLVILPAGADRRQIDIFWELVTSAAYYYIAMNVINMNLIRYIGITSDKHTTQSLRLVSRDMENIINSVTILKLRYSDLAAELNGAPRQIFQAIQKIWDFKNITDNMQSKLELCRTNIQTLSVEMQRRNQGRIETVLTGVAGMTILSVFIELGSYATQMPNENKWMVGKIPGFMDLGFALSGNALSWIAIVMAGSVLAFTIKHRSG
jgi:hypothetical protein